MLPQQAGIEVRNLRARAALLGTAKHLFDSLKKRWTSRLILGDRAAYPAKRIVTCLPTVHPRTSPSQTRLNYLMDTGVKQPTPPSRPIAIDCVYSPPISSIGCQKQAACAQFRHIMLSESQWQKNDGLQLSAIPRGRAEERREAQKSR